MSDNYRPYQPEWESETTVADFSAWLTHQLANFDANLARLKGDTALNTKEEWMSLFLLWMEYSK